MNDEMILKLSPWFHNIHLPDGTQTAPDHFLGDFPKFKWDQIQAYIPVDLKGWRVLDIGCNAGFYAIELAKRGAEVLAIDVDEHYLKQAKWVAEQFDFTHQISFKQMQVYDLARLKETFDLVWFMGVFYHLRYPMLALDIIASRMTSMMVFQTLTIPDGAAFDTPEDLSINQRELLNNPGWPKMAFIEKKLAGDPTNWWAPNHSCIKAMLSSCGIVITATPGHEIYICHKQTEGSYDYKWNLSEYLSATGRHWKSDVKKKTKDKSNIH